MEGVKSDRGFWVDKNNNCWDSLIYTQEEALEHSKSLVNCIDCVNCEKCTNCKDCVNCENCVDCEECKNCKDYEKCFNIHLGEEA